MWYKNNWLAIANQRSDRTRNKMNDPRNTRNVVKAGTEMIKTWTDHKMEKPTMAQIRYLEELRKDAGGRGMLTRVAAACKTHHDLVRRFVRRCMEVGYVDDAYRLTKSGEQWLDEYVRIRDSVKQYFLYIGVDESKVEEKTANLLEAMDLATIYLMLATLAEQVDFQIFKWEVDFPEEYLNHLLERGSVNLPFHVFKMQEEHGTAHLSMAHQGFQSPAVLKKNNRGMFLIMSVCDVTANSMVSGKKMTGHLSRLQYEQNGNMIPTEIRNSKVKIPLEACKFRKRLQGGYEASVSILCGCTVGAHHMPESKAKLVFWM